MQVGRLDPDLRAAHSQLPSICDLDRHAGAKAHVRVRDADLDRVDQALAILARLDVARRELGARRDVEDGPLEDLTRIRVRDDPHLASRGRCRELRVRKVEAGARLRDVGHRKDARARLNGFTRL